MSFIYIYSLLLFDNASALRKLCFGDIYFIIRVKKKFNHRTESNIQCVACLCSDRDMVDRGRRAKQFAFFFNFDRAKIERVIDV